jgi:hypothetical protein
MKNKEATARIKINKLLDAAGWRWIYEPKKGKPGQLYPGLPFDSSIKER